jgi:hypothetical protein
MVTTYISQIISILGPLCGVVIGGCVTYIVQTRLTKQTENKSKQNEIKAIYSKLWGLKKLITQLYISRGRAEVSRLYYTNYVRIKNEGLRPDLFDKKVEKIESKNDRLDIEIAHTEAQKAEVCGKAFLFISNEEDRGKIQTLLNSPNLTYIQEKFLTEGAGVTSIAKLDEWRDKMNDEVIKSVEAKINECFSEVESIGIFKI